MKRLIAALLAVIFVVSTAAIVSGACPAGCTKGCCQKADPNSK